MFNHIITVLMVVSEMTYTVSSGTLNPSIPYHGINVMMYEGGGLVVVAVVAGRSGLAVACLTAVREVLGSNRAVGSCVYCKTTVIYSLEHGLCAPFLQCLGQLSLIPYVGR